MKIAELVTSIISNMSCMFTSVNLVDDLVYFSSGILRIYLKSEFHIFVKLRMEKSSTHLHTCGKTPSVTTLFIWPSLKSEFTKSAEFGQRCSCTLINYEAVLFERCIQIFTTTLSYWMGPLRNFPLFRLKILLDWYQKCKVAKIFVT